MPTVNPRISVTLSQPLSACLKELSALTGNSQSALIGDLLADSLPVFERMVQVLRAAERAKAQGLEIRNEVGESLREAHERLQQQLGLELEAAGDVAGLLESVESVPRRAAPKRAERARHGAAATAATPMSNRGVTPHRNTKSKAGKQAAKGA